MSLEPVTYDLANSMFPVSSIFHRYKPIKVKQNYKIKKLEHNVWVSKELKINVLRTPIW